MGLAEGVSLGVSVLALLIALAAAVRLEWVGRIAHGLKDDLAIFSASQEVKLEELTDATAQIRSTTEQLLESAVSPEERDTVEDQAEAAVAGTAASAYEQMQPVAIPELPQDIANATTQRAGAEISWALKRRGPGRPRWLIGTVEGGPWRVTKRHDGVAVEEEAAAFKDQVQPLSLEDLGDDAYAALRKATGLGSLRSGDVVFQRKGRRGVPVYYAVLSTASGGSSIWRLVKTRWGWSAVAEDNR
jgi:hypothetical protein